MAVCRNRRPLPPWVSTAAPAFTANGSSPHRKRVRHTAVIRGAAHYPAPKMRSRPEQADNTSRLAAHARKRERSMPDCKVNNVAFPCC